VKIYLPAMRSIQQRLGLAVRRLRLSQGYSQEKFAATANLNRSYMGQLERGEVNISLANLERLANGLGLTIGQLMLEVDDQK
jgi:transcriptional regulator with XRE-family HTH domain